MNSGVAAGFYGLALHCKIAYISRDVLPPTPAVICYSTVHLTSKRPLVYLKSLCAVGTAFVSK